MSDDLQFIDKTGCMPTGDDAEEALREVTNHIRGSISALPIELALQMPIELALQMPNIHRCLIAFLAISRMKEAKEADEKRRAEGETSGKTN